MLILSEPAPGPKFGNVSGVATSFEATHAWSFKTFNANARENGVKECIFVCAELFLAFPAFSTELQGSDPKPVRKNIS